MKMTFNSSNARLVLQDDVKDTLRCRYRGFMEHTHNFHLPFKYFGNRFMHICSRCLGLYGGIVIWLILFLCSPFVSRYLDSLVVLETLFLCFILTVPLVVDWWLQCLAIHHSNNGVRFTTGLLTSLSGMIMFFSPQIYWISLPCSYLWMRLVRKVGIKWRKKRDPNWGCWACQGDVPKAKAIFGKGDEKFDKI